MSYSLVKDSHRNAYLEYLEQSLEIACVFDTQYLVIHSNGMDGPKILDNDTTESTIKKVAAMTKTLEKAAALAKTYQKTLVIEALNTFTIPGYFLNRTAYSGDLCRVINSENLKILYDIWHMQLMEGNIVQNLLEYSDVIGYIHVGDSPERHEPGTGEINFHRVKRTVEAIGYDGFWGFELVPEQNSTIACERILSF